MVLPKLEIRSPENAYTLKQLEVLLDGHPIKGLRSLDLYLQSEDVNTIAIRLAVGEVIIDPKTLVLLEAYVHEEKEQS